MNNFRRLFALNRKLPWQFVYQSQVFQARHLFTPSSLGLDTFVSISDRIRESLPDVEEFKRKMKTFSEPESNSLVLLDDVKKMVAVTETDEDLKLLHELLIIYFKEQETISFKHFKISPVVMRALHVLNKPKEAIQIVEDPVCNPHFHVFSTALVFMDLLLKNGMYNEVLKFYNHFESSFNTFPNHLTLILLAACYKLNTEESFSKAKAIFKLETDFRPSFRKTIFMAALAINQNDAFCALEVLHYLKKLDTIPANIKLMALMKGGRHTDAFSLAQHLLGRGTENKFYIPADVLSNLEKEFENAPEEYKSTFEGLLKKFETCVTPEPLDKFLFAEVQLSRPQGNQNELPRRTAESRRF